MDKIAWSWSRIDMFEACRLLFQHNHILKTVKFVQNAAMIRGELIHKKLERNVVRIMNKQPPIEGKPGDTNVLHVTPIIQQFVANHPGIYMEEEVTLTDRWKPTGWFSKDAWLRAKMDLIGIANPLAKRGQIMSILDWKTGAVRDSPGQLRLYNLVALKKWPIVDSVSSVFCFVDHSKFGKQVTSTRDDLYALEQEFGERQEAIQVAAARNYWPPTKNFRCQWCNINDCQFVRSR